MVKEILLQNGMVALVDDEDFERVNIYHWAFRVNKGNQVQIRATIDNKKISLHRFIMGVPEGMNVVFVNGDKLDCRRRNLKLGGAKSVALKRKAKRNSSSKYRGVWRKSNGKWVARLRVDGKAIHLGTFINEDDAAIAYNEASLAIRGKEGFQNEIGVDNSAKNVQMIHSKQKRRKRNEGYRGVNANGSKFRTYISIDKKFQYIGTFLTEKLAAKAYDRKAYELHGDEAILNFPHLIDEYKSNLKGVEPK